MPTYNLLHFSQYRNCEYNIEIFFFFFSCNVNKHPVTLVQAMLMFFTFIKSRSFFVLHVISTYIFFIARFTFNFSCEITPEHFFNFPCFCIVNSLMRFSFYVFRCIFRDIDLFLLTWVFLSMLSCTPSSDFSVFSVLILLLLELRYGIIHFMCLLF